MRNSELRVLVQDMLVNHFSQFYESDPDTLPPLNFRKVVVLRDISAELQVCYVTSFLQSVYKVES